MLHTLIRKNYGVTHFIVGRDHAGVGNYYGTYDAQKIFDQFDLPKDIGVTILKVQEHTAWCKTCEAVVKQQDLPARPRSEGRPERHEGSRTAQGGSERRRRSFRGRRWQDILIKWAQG